MLASGDEYLDTLTRIETEIQGARQRAVLGANTEMIRLYWRIGGAINEHLNWGNKFIDTLSHDVRIAFPGVKGFSARSMKYMAKFAREVDPELCNSCCTIPWGHITHLLDKTEPGKARNWYIRAVAERGWSRAVLVRQVELKLYERQALGGTVNNFERSLPGPERKLAQQVLKDPYIFDFITARQSVAERDVEKEMVSNVTALLLELGTGFAFMGKQYRLLIGGEYFYIDLLFYNTQLHCYFVVELKTTDFKPEYVGKLNFYLAAVDDILRGERDNPTIGLLLCKDKNNAVAEYSLCNMTSPMGVSEYRTAETLPDGISEFLPSPEDIKNCM